MNLLTHLGHPHFKKPIDEYTGPGLLVEWLKIEGPFDPLPPPGYQRLFAGVPLKPRSVAKAEAKGKTPPRSPTKRSEYDWAADPLVPASAHPKEDAERLIRDFPAACLPPPG